MSIQNPFKNSDRTYIRDLRAKPFLALSLLFEKIPLERNRRRLHLGRNRLLIVPERHNGISVAHMSLR